MALGPPAAAPLKEVKGGKSCGASLLSLSPSTPRPEQQLAPGGYRVLL